MIPLQHQFRREQWRRWLMTDGGCDPEQASRLAQRLISRAADRGEMEPAGADPFEEPPTARRVQQHDL